MEPASESCAIEVQRSSHVTGKKSEQQITVISETVYMTHRISGANQGGTTEAFRSLLAGMEGFFYVIF